MIDRLITLIDIGEKWPRLANIASEPEILYKCKQTSILSFIKKTRQIRLDRTDFFTGDAEHYTP